MQTVTLINGAEEARVLVNATMRSLTGLMEWNPIAFYELVMKCRDSNHIFFGNVADVLKRLRLVEASGSIHNSVRNIVLSATKGERLDMTLDSPVQK